MKKLFNFLLLMLTLTISLPVWAVTKSASLYIDNAANLEIKATTTWYSGSDLGSFSNGWNTVTTPDRVSEATGDFNIMIHNKSGDSATFYKVVVNGTTVVTPQDTNKEFKILGNSAKIKVYVINLKNYDGGLIEIYTSASNCPYYYPVNFDITDPDSKISSIKIGNSTKSAPWGSSYSYCYDNNETFEVTASAAATVCTFDGSDVSDSGSGSTHKYTFSKLPPTSSTPTFKIVIPSTVGRIYPTYVDNSNMVLGYTVNGSAIGSDMKYNAGDEIKIYTIAEPSTPSYSYNGGANTANLTFTDGTYNGQACKVTTFTAPAGDIVLTMKFDDNVCKFYITDSNYGTDVNEYTQYLGGYIKTRLVGDPDDMLPLEFDSNNYAETTFGAGDTYTLYIKGIPEYVKLWDNYSASLVNSKVSIEPGEAVVKDDETLYPYTFTPIHNGMVEVYFGDKFEVSSGGGETTVTGDPFSIIISADRNGAVVATVYSKAGAVEQVVPVTTTNTTINVGPDGYIKATVTDESMYSFQTFKNQTENVEFLDYDPPTTYPVTIRKTRPTSDTSQIDNDGDTFYVTTNSKENLQWYALTVNIVDDASNVQVEVGTSNLADSQANHEFSNIAVGNNNISFSEEDTYLVISSNNFTVSIYDVTTSTGTINKSETLPPVYVIPLSAAMNGATVTVTVNKPMEGSKSMTAVISDIDKIDAFKLYENEDDWMGTDIKSSLHDGNNTLLYEEGMFFKIWLVSECSVNEISLNGTDIAIDDWGYYMITPVNNGRLVVDVTEAVQEVLPTFTLLTDSPVDVINVINWATDAEYAITEQSTQIPMHVGDDFRVYISSRTPRVVSKNDVDITPVNGYYGFTPAENDIVKFYFDEILTPMFTVFVDDASKVASLVNYDAIESYQLQNGTNSVPVGESGDTFRLTPAAGVTFASFKVDGDEVTISNRGYYSFTIHEGSTVEIVCNNPPVVTVSFANSGTEGVLKFVQVNNVDVNVDDLQSGLTIGTGDELWFCYENQNDKYQINSITVNGVALAQYTGSIYYEHVYEDIEVVFDVTAVNDVPFVFWVDNPENVVITNGNNVINLADFRPIEGEDYEDQDYSYADGYVYLKVKSNNNVITVTPVLGIELASVSEAESGIDFAIGANGASVITVEANMVIEVRTRAIQNDDTFMITIDIVSTDAPYAGFENAASIVALSGRVPVITDVQGNTLSKLMPGRNLVHFNKAYDKGFIYAFGTMPKSLHTYLGENEIKVVTKMAEDGEEVDPELILRGDVYFIDPEDGDLVRSYFRYYAEEETFYKSDTEQWVTEMVEKDRTPEVPHTVTFDIDEEIEGDVMILREEYQKVDHSHPVAESHNTHYAVYVTTGKYVSLLAGSPAYVDSQASKLNVGNRAPKHRIVANEEHSHTAPDGYDFVYCFNINEPTKVMIAKNDNETTGVEDIEAAFAGTADIYNLQGILVKSAANAADLRELPAGLYIFGGRKVIVK